MITVRSLQQTDDWQAASRQAADVVMQHMPAAYREGLDLPGVQAQIELLWADALEREGHVLLAEGPLGVEGSLIFVCAESPVAHYSEGVVSDLLAAHADSAALLLAKAEALATAKGLPFLYAESAVWLEDATRAFTARGWRSSGLFVKLPLERPVEPVQPAAPYAIRAAVPDDAEFVLECLFTANTRSLGDDEQRHFDAAKTRETLRAAYAPLLRAERHVLLLECDGAACGHNLIELDRAHRYTGSAEVELVDTFVLPAHEGRGLSRALSTHGIDACRTMGYRWMTGSVLFEGSSKGDQILESLKRTGWQAEYWLWRKCLDTR